MTHSTQIMMISKRKYKTIYHSSLYTKNLVFSFEWQGTLADIRRQRLQISMKNNSPLFAQEQTYMGDVSRDKYI